ncbi:MAG: tyrosine decarboxylase MfnA [Euryarchaeota archaeon]|nr:tyrosine decarboxylase MfnA [Euryarchaeota archaeon]
MERAGLPWREVSRILAKALETDSKYREGRILGSMCTSPHPRAKEVHSLFLESNLGDSGLFPGTRALEKEVIRLLGTLLGEPRAKGYVVSGGTEANITAFWAARNRARARREVVVPDTAHFSIEKAADLLGLRLVRARSNPDHTVDVGDVRRRTGKRTVAIVGVAGSTEYGTVDDIEALSELVLEKDIHLHVDAAFGGFVIPFLRSAGYEFGRFDFSLPGVASITIDPHKMGLAPVGSGCILFRDREILRYIETPSPYLTQRRQSTITGTRSGASAAATLAVLKHLGKEGYEKVARGCMENALGLYRGLRGLGLAVLEPTMNIVVFAPPRPGAVARGLEARGWRVSRTKKGEIRLVVMPHVRKRDVRSFLQDLEEVLRDV